MKQDYYNVTTLRNVGLNKGTPRIWLEGNKLDIIGFVANVRYAVKINKQTIVLTLDEDGEKKVSSKASKDPNYRTPVIDLHNSGLSDFLNGSEQVEVNHQPGIITIKRVKP